MANSFVKWCRAKFLNGYKHINVLAQEEGCGRSDTETLVRACEDDILLTPTPTPIPHAHNNTQGTHGAYVEEVSCDVSVAAGGETDRQEFSFTLYDFDGHGKVTKDDIAGLVRTIYDAVGSSLSLPPSGSRTIRVKLTVAPEGRKSRQQEQHQQSQQQHQEQQEVGDDPQQQDLGDFRRDEEGTGDQGVEPCEHSSGRSHRRRKMRRRSTSLQRHELLQIIQANMEKNNLYYTPFHRRHDHHHHHNHSHDHHHHHSHGRRRRRRCGCERYCDHSGSPPDPAEVKARLLEPDCPCRHGHYHSHAHNPTSSSNNASCRRHNRSHSHDLSHDSPHSHDLSHDSPHVFRCHLLDKTFQPLPPSNTPDQPPSPPVARLNDNANNNNNNNNASFPQYQPHYYPFHYHHHHRSRSFDGVDTHQASSPRGRSSRTPRNQQSQQQQQSQKESKQLKQEYILGTTELSPHHTKHKHKEANHARAMAQVVAWLEKGSLLDPTASPTSPEAGNVGGGVGGGGGACREQTHHVHQHIHHHYHHYGENQPPLLI